MCVVAWVLMSGEPSFSRQAGPASLGVGGLLVTCYAHVAWVLRGRWAIGFRSRDLLAGMTTLPAAVAAGPTAQSRETLVAGHNMRYFHRDKCPLAAGRGWASASAERHVADGRQPCGMCRP
jgi:hypothetical protein